MALYRGTMEIGMACTLENSDLQVIVSRDCIGLCELNASLLYCWAYKVKAWIYSLLHTRLYSSKDTLRFIFLLSLKLEMHLSLSCLLGSTYPLFLTFTADASGLLLFKLVHHQMKNWLQVANRCSRGQHYSFLSPSPYLY